MQRLIKARANGEWERWIAECDTVWFPSEQKAPYVVRTQTAVMTALRSWLNGPFHAAQRMCCMLHQTAMRRTRIHTYGYV